MVKILPWMHNKKIIEETAPTFRFDGTRKFSEWQSEAHAKLSSLLGLENIKKPADDKFTVEYTKECDDSIAAMNHCVCNFVPNIAKYFDMGEIGGLIAPRGLVVVNGRTDRIFPEAGTREVFDEIEKIYASAGVQARCRLVTGEGRHRFYTDIAWPHVHELAGI